MTELEIQESKSKLLLKADKMEVEALKVRINNLENRSERNNTVIWGVQEGSEKDFASMQEFIEVQLFQNHKNFERRIEGMRAHRASIKRNPSENNTSKPRPIHVYLLRYTDKALVKLVARKLKRNKRVNDFHHMKKIGLVLLLFCLPRR